MKNKRQRNIILTIIISWLLILTIFVITAYGTCQEETKSTTRYIYTTTNLDKLKIENMALKYALEDAREIKSLLSENNYIGEFQITYYTANFESTGKNPGDKDYGITASGEPVKEDYTIASDWSVLPVGSRVFIEGIGIRTVEDSGSAIIGNKLDIYTKNLEDIPSIGRHMAKVYLLD
jgi:3D (Asp-Asp-Asp) domain-containing protein